jgi:glycosyltransferase involved in cell wall biosynthesis
MSPLPAVTVIIPTFNRANYVGQAIRSVLDQEPSDRLVEIIVVDDGSTDETAQAIQPFLDKIKYLVTNHAGISHARNTGMAAASGEYLAFLDSDDLFYPYKIKLQATCLDLYPQIAMVCTEASAFDDHGFWDEYHLKTYHKPAYSRADTSYDTIWAESVPLEQTRLQYGKWQNRKLYLGNIFNVYLQSLIVFTNTVMIRRSILDRVGRQNEAYWLLEEFDFFLRCAKYDQAAFIDVPTYKLRYHTGQISTTAQKHGLDITIEKQKTVLQIVETHGLKDAGYYAGHKQAMDKRLAALHKALAIPLMSKRGEARSARSHLQACATYGYPEKELQLLTFLPYDLRRIALKVRALIKSR